MKGRLVFRCKRTYLECAIEHWCFMREFLPRRIVDGVIQTHRTIPRRNQQELIGIWCESYGRYNIVWSILQLNLRFLVHHASPHNSIQQFYSLFGQQSKDKANNVRRMVHRVSVVMVMSMAVVRNFRITVKIVAADAAVASHLPVNVGDIYLSHDKEETKLTNAIRVCFCSANGRRFYSSQKKLIDQ